MSWVIDSGEKVHSYFQNFCFRNRVISEMLKATYGLSRKLHAEFCVKITKVGISILSLDFSKAKSGRIYGREWLMYVITVN